MQENIWEKEYKDPKLVTLSSDAAMSLKDFTRWIRRDQKIELKGVKILDLGCGNAKNSFYMADQGLNNEIVGIDISETALRYAKELAPTGKFIKQSIGVKFPLADASFDVALDVTSSNSLNESERKIYLEETYRVLKPSAYLFVRTLCKDADKNAQNLIKEFPGPEKDTYIMPELGLIERVFSKDDFISTYSPFFEILHLEKETHYTKFNGRPYKRNFWLAYLKKK
jgi:ubiquinone/menaquinone biosynthesis C-methylase UbiE